MRKFGARADKIVRMDLRELKVFVAVVEEQGMSAASRRLHVSQSALSQTINLLERELGVPLLVRSSTGVRPTAAGATLVNEARAVLARHAQALRTMAAYTANSTGAVRLGIPLELPPTVLPDLLSKMAAERPGLRIAARHLSTAAQLAALRRNELDVGLVRDRPAGAEFDAMLAVQERMGVLVAASLAAERGGPDGMSLDALAGMDWAGFARSEAPAWHDEITAVLRGHGIDVGGSFEDEQALVPAVKVLSAGAGTAFALAPPCWPHPIPDGISWVPLIGAPLIRRTWVVWAADSRSREVGQLVGAFCVTDL